MIFVAKAVFCQKSGDKIAPITDLYSLKSPSQTRTRQDFNTWFEANNKQVPVRVSMISSDQYTKNFGFFCKKELQFEKATKVPFKFRVGTVQYCDWMEGKKNAGILPVH